MDRWTGGPVDWWTGGLVDWWTGGQVDWGFDGSTARRLDGLMDQGLFLGTVELSYLLCRTLLFYTGSCNYYIFNKTASNAL